MFFIIFLICFPTIVVGNTFSFTWTTTQKVVDNVQCKELRIYDSSHTLVGICDTESCYKTDELDPTVSKSNSRTLLRVGGSSSSIMIMGNDSICLKGLNTTWLDLAYRNTTTKSPTTTRIITTIPITTQTTLRTSIFKNTNHNKQKTSPSNNKILTSMETVTIKNTPESTPKKIIEQIAVFPEKPVDIKKEIGILMQEFFSKREQELYKKIEYKDKEYKELYSTTMTYYILWIFGFSFCIIFLGIILNLYCFCQRYKYKYARAKLYEKFGNQFPYKIEEYITPEDRMLV